MLWMQSRFLMSLCYFMTFSSRVFTRDLMHFLQLETNKNSGWHSTLWFVANDCLNHRPTLRCIDDLNCWAAVFCSPVDSGWDSLREYVSHIPDCHIPHHDSFSQINVEHSNSFYSSELDFFKILHSTFIDDWWLMIDLMMILFPGYHDVHCDRQQTGEPRKQDFCLQQLHWNAEVDKVCYETLQLQQKQSRRGYQVWRERWEKLRITM